MDEFRVWLALGAWLLLTTDWLSVLKRIEENARRLRRLVEHLDADP